MAAETELDLGPLDELFGAAAMEAAQDEMSSHWRDLMEPHVPIESGALRGSVTVDGQEITYTEDYANIVYNMDDQATNWTAGKSQDVHSHWGDYAKSLHLGELEEYMARFIMRGAE